MYDSKSESMGAHAANYERTLACDYYTRLCALYEAVMRDFCENGKPKRTAARLADAYVSKNYCEGHSRAVYAIAKARLQVVREGIIPSNASVLPRLWAYDPYLRLSEGYINAVVAACG